MHKHEKVKEQTVADEKKKNGKVFENSVQDGKRRKKGRSVNIDIMIYIWDYAASFGLSPMSMF